MKKISFIALFVLLTGLAATSSAQVHVNVSVNITSQPAWGPTGYDNVQYYYLPDLEAYYYVPRHKFVFFENNRWVFVKTLPDQYRDFDLYHSYKVVINEPKPYLHFQEDRVKYAQYKNWKLKQEVIEDRKTDPKYRTHWHDDFGHRGTYTH